MTDDRQDSSYTTYLHGRGGERVEVRADAGDVAAVLAAGERLDDPDVPDKAGTGGEGVGWVSGVRAVVVTAVAALVSILRR